MGISASVSLVDNKGNGDPGSLKGLALAIELLEKPLAGRKGFHSTSAVSSSIVTAGISNANLDYYLSPKSSNGFFYGSSSPILKTALCEELRDNDSVYVIRVKPLLSAFHWRALATTTMRSFLLNYLPVLEEYLKIEEEEEEEKRRKEEESGEAPPSDEKKSIKPLPDLIEPGKKTAWGIFREVTITTYRVILERIIFTYATRRTASKLIKDYSKSAQRKYRRGIRGFVLSKKMTVTSFRANILFYSAVWVFQSQQDLQKCILKLHKSFKQNSIGWVFLKDVKSEGSYLSKKAVTHLVKGSLTLIISSSFVGLGSVFWPGKGSWLGFVSGEILGFTLLSKAVDGLMGV